MKGPAPCCAVPLTVPPEAVSAVIELAPPPAAVAADQLRPSGELHVTARGASSITALTASGGTVSGTAQQGAGPFIVTVPSP